jgi:hypothetical protein
MKNNVTFLFAILENQSLANEEISCYPFLDDSTKPLIIPQLVSSISNAMGHKIPDEDFKYFTTLQSAIEYLDSHYKPNVA